MKPINIFRSGCYIATSGKQLCLNDAQLVQLANDYNQGYRIAPLVFGHPADDQPAHGHFARLTVRDGVLLAEPVRVSEKARDSVRRAQYKYVSSAFYLPEDPRNPTPGRYFLKHVGLLGAMPPAVKGLGGVAFCECSDCAGQAQGQALELAEPSTATGFTLPAGYAADQARLQLHQQALAYQVLHGGDYFAAVAAVERA